MGSLSWKWKLDRRQRWLLIGSNEGKAPAKGLWDIECLMSRSSHPVGFDIKIMSVVVVNITVVVIRTAIFFLFIIIILMNNIFISIIIFIIVVTAVFVIIYHHHWNYCYSYHNIWSTLCFNIVIILIGSCHHYQEYYHWREWKVKKTIIIINK